MQLGWAICMGRFDLGFAQNIDYHFDQKRKGIKNKKEKITKVSSLIQSNKNTTQRKEENI